MVFPVRRMSITIGDLVLVGAPTQTILTDPHGHFITSHTFWGGTAGETKLVDKPFGSGSFLPVKRSVEPFTFKVEGWSNGRDRNHWQELLQEIRSVSAEQATVDVQLIDNLNEYHRTAVLLDVSSSDDHGQSVFDWALDFKCPDPRAYSPGTWKRLNEDVTNLGTVSSPVIVAVRLKPGAAPVDDIYVAEEGTGNVLQWIQGHATESKSGFKKFGQGQTLILDPEQGMPLLDGLPNFGLRRAQWFYVPPNSTRRYVASEQYSNVLDFQFLQRSAW